MAHMSVPLDLIDLGPQVLQGHPKSESGSSGKKAIRCVESQRMIQKQGCFWMSRDRVCDRIRMDQWVSYYNLLLINGG